MVEFWRRWHITLSSFLRDYVYVPLGGSRDGRLRTMCNLLLVMLVGGLWHGANWTFVAWGGLHGIALVVNHAWRQLSFVQQISPMMRRVGGWMSMSVVVLLGWILFRSPGFTIAERWLHSIVTNHGKWVHTLTYSQRWLIAGLTVWVIVMPNVPSIFRIEADRDHVDWEKPAGIPRVPLWTAALAALALAGSVAVMAREKHNAFIYFQF